MPRAKITAYVPPDLADALKRMAAVEDRSVSDIIEDALAQRFSGHGGAVEHAALMARLDLLLRRLGVIEKAQETHVELTAQGARFVMSLAPEIPESDRAALNARGGERYRNLLALIATRLADGRSAARDLLAAETEAVQSRRAAE
jgi:DNA-binding transcriptional MocR family regulator